MKAGAGIGPGWPKLLHLLLGRAELRVEWVELGGSTCCLLNAETMDMLSQTGPQYLLAHTKPRAGGEPVRGTSRKPLLDHCFHR